MSAVAVGPELPPDVDRQLDQLGAKSAVDDEFAKLKAEVGAGAQPSALPAGEPARGESEAAPTERGS